MGDKSPKAKDKAKKQDTAENDKKKAAAIAKARANDGSASVKKPK